MTATAQLRILETTDLHMHLLGYDYHADRPDPARGLAPLCDVISARRRAAPGATLLFDNGDFFQGTPLADSLAHAGDHPLAAAFNTLGYDAVTLGNHEFDYGIPALAGFLAQLDCPVVSANAESPDPTWLPATILTRPLVCSDGRTRTIRIGVTGFAPPSLTRACGLHVRSMTAALAQSLPALKDADLVIALCHGGLDDARTPAPESANVIAQAAGVHVVLMGHTHDVFPAGRNRVTRDVDEATGTIHGKPAVMAGCHGGYLGEIDLTLTHDKSGWQVRDGNSRLHPNGQTDLPTSPARTAIEALAAPHHARMQSQMQTPIGKTDRLLHNRFATILPDPVGQLFADVMRRAVTRALDAPCDIAAVAPFQLAGMQGRHLDIALPAGPLTRRDAARLFPYSDRLRAVRRTGRELRDWLERSAANYVHLTDRSEAPPLIVPDSAGYHRDALFGLQYDIDLGLPPCFDLAGLRIRGGVGRVRNIRLHGQPLHDDADYVVATTDFRAGGAGGYPPIPEVAALWRSPTGLRDILIEAIGDGAALDLVPAPVWRFCGPRGQAVRIDAGQTPVPASQSETPPGWTAITGEETAGGWLMHF